MAIENAVSNDILSMFVPSIYVSNWRLSGVVMDISMSKYVSSFSTLQKNATFREHVHA